jgi:hypothetical protein
MKATATVGLSASSPAMAANRAAAVRSDTIMTRLRLNRSPSVPASGPMSPLVPNVSSRVAASHAADPVRLYTKKFRAAKAALVPVCEMNRANARRRTAVPAEVGDVMKASGVVPHRPPTGRRDAGDGRDRVGWP